jgi:hypothetical protein
MFNITLFAKADGLLTHQTHDIPLNLWKNYVSCPCRNVKPLTSTKILSFLVENWFVFYISGFIAYTKVQLNNSNTTTTAIQQTQFKTDLQCR